jgi:electron transfer flavoprotein beta subunit
VRILVLLELAGDVSLRAQSDGLRDERFANAERAPHDWRIRQVDPAAQRALDLALDLKTMAPGTEVTLVHLGPDHAEHWMREEAARGCDGVLRVWDGELAGACTQVKALVLAAAAQSWGFDLVLAGAASLSSAGGQLGVVAAAHLGVPCVTQVCAIEPVGDAGPDALVVTRALAGGYRERASVTLPAVVTVVPAAKSPANVAAVPELLRWRAETIPVWDVARLGVPREQLQAAARPLRASALRSPRPRRKPIAAPDQSAPAFDRILQLVAGTVQRRRAQVVRGTPDELAVEIVATMSREGWLDHLRRDAADAGPNAGLPRPSAGPPGLNAGASAAAPTLPDLR